MVEIFPEIESFFQQEQFSQEQLDVLKATIESAYKNEQIRKSATSAINIKLLQYQLSGPTVARVKQKIKNVKSKIKGTKAISSTKLSKAERKDQRLKKKGEEFIARNTMDVVQLFYEHNLNQPLKKGAIYLELTIEEFLSELENPNGNIVNEDSRFDEYLWEANKKWIAPRLKLLSRKAKNSKQKKVKKSDNRTKVTGGVYGKLLKVKNIGSLIYTRM